MCDRLINIFNTIRWCQFPLFVELCTSSSIQTLLMILYVYLAIFVIVESLKYFIISASSIMNKMLNTRVTGIYSLTNVQNLITYMHDATNIKYIIKIYIRVYIL